MPLYARQVYQGSRCHFRIRGHVQGPKDAVGAEIEFSGIREEDRDEFVGENVDSERPKDE